MPANETVHRPTTLDEVLQCTTTMFGQLRDPEQVFTPRPDDVIISPYAKCGTTWLQQIFHTLRTRGDTDYDDISRVVPWIETSPGLGLDLDAEQKANPRGFKSHLPWDAIPKGGRYIVSFRDPRDAVLSFYKFFEGWFFEPGSIGLDEFLQAFAFGRPPGMSYWDHLVSWWSQRDNPDVLMLSYEGMKADPDGTIRRVAEFCNIELDDELLAITRANSSLDFMKRHKDKFDDRLMREASERLCGLPPGGDSAKVRAGQVGEHKQVLSEQVLDQLEQRWQSEVTPGCGFPDYDSLQQDVEERLD